MLLEEIIKIGFPDVYSVFRSYISNWKWPARVHWSHLHEIFNADRAASHRKAKHIKMQASDGLSLTGVAAMFCMNVLLKLPGPMGDSCRIHCYAFLALIDVIELIVAAARVAVPPKQLLKAVEKFLHLFKDAWGCSFMTPKFHWLLHLWKPLQRHGFLLNCFCLERKHRLPKRYATEITNAQKLNSASLLMEVTCQHLSELQQPDAFQFSVGLVDSHPASSKVKKILPTMFGLELDGDTAESIKVSTTCRFSPVGLCHKADLVLFKDESGAGFKVGKVKLHFEVAWHFL